MTTLAQAIKVTANTMTIHGNLALARFVECNPHYKGADWWDVLSILIDSDSHLDLTEPLYEALDFLPEDRKPFIAPVAITLAWSGLTPKEGEVAPATVHEWCNVLSDRCDNSHSGS